MTEASQPEHDRRASLAPWERVLNAPFIAAIWFYRITLSPLMGGYCRFRPTCSVYGLEAYRTHGPLRGTWLTLRRVSRCHPFGGKGFDPVPPRVERASAPRE